MGLFVCISLSHRLYFHLCFLHRHLYESQKQLLSSKIDFSHLSFWVLQYVVLFPLDSSPPLSSLPYPKSCHCQPELSFKSPLWESSPEFAHPPAFRTQIGVPSLSTPRALQMTPVAALLTLYLYVHACLPWNEESLKAVISIWIVCVHGN